MTMLLRFSKPLRLRNPNFAALDQEARQNKCVELHHARLLRVLSFIRESIRPAVARDFFRKQWITEEQYKASVGKGLVVPSPSSGTADEQDDTIMNDVMDTFCSSPSASSNTLTGAGEPVEEL
ncbi:hypothetical protein G6F56_006680 [Rhizopus delemar]|nr:hypothetical protein G6F56_006680 [Rhizopus delemar]